MRVMIQNSSCAHTGDICTFELKPTGASHALRVLSLLTERDAVTSHLDTQAVAS
jgi:hypothetical protein